MVNGRGWIYGRIQEVFSKGTIVAYLYSIELGFYYSAYIGYKPMVGWLHSNLKIRSGNFSKHVWLTKLSSEVRANCSVTLFLMLSWPNSSESALTFNLVLREDQKELNPNNPLTAKSNWKYGLNTTNLVGNTQWLDWNIGDGWYVDGSGERLLTMVKRS